MDSAHHKLLERQIRRHLPGELVGDDRFAGLFAAISDAYTSADEGRVLMERSMEISSDELCLANAEMRGILGTLPDGVLMLDPEGCIREAKGKPLQPDDPGGQVVGAQLTDFLCFEEPGALCDAIREVRFHESPEPICLECTSVRGSMEFEVLLLPHSEQRTLTIVRDVTHRNRVENDLLTARHKAETATKAKSEFLATMSHELRTPLNGMIGVVELLQGTTLGEEQGEFARILQVSGERLLTIINDILDFSKVECGKIELESVQFSPLEIVEDSLEMCSELANKKRLEIGVSTSRDLAPIVMGDPVRFGQVVTNLISNAVKFTDTGNVTVHMRSELHDGQPRVYLDVEDSGIGVTPAQADVLFDSFTQADSSTTRRFGGTGLGLAISKKLVELMGGTITIESTVGEGSTFSFFVNVGAAPSAVAPAPYNLGEKVVLCVDDNEVNLAILKGQLEPHVQTVVGFDSSLAPQILSEPAGYDIAVVDMDMPGLDGLALIRALRATTWGRSLPAILLSSQADPELSRRAEEQGVNSVLRKPVRKRSLLQHIERCLHGAADETELAQPDHAVPDSARLPLRILLAEDNGVNQRVARMMIERLGYQVHIVDNGQEAVNAHRSAPYDLILMDGQMPVMDGFESTRVIRALPGSIPQPVIVALTANVLDSDRERCFEAGMDDFLAKPLRMAGLSQAIDRAYSLLEAKRSA